MIWRVDFSPEAVKFLRNNNLLEVVIVDKIKLAVRKFGGEDINISIKKLTGAWEGFYRIRSGRLRIIVEFQFAECRAYIEVIDWRGNVYK